VAALPPPFPIFPRGEDCGHDLQPFHSIGHPPNKKKQRLSEEESRRFFTPAAGFAVLRIPFLFPGIENIGRTGIRTCRPPAGQARDVSVPVRPAGIGGRKGRWLQTGQRKIGAPEADGFAAGKEACDTLLGTNHIQISIHFYL